eukprot:CAMPEP_0113937782 /NCGR_PEP_ID=MMETSP1339-20121228/4328_1 /TAXON_ID=94617 /ORGANISM="Fibrocapsa japonica" /LENGTH=295 /DNA_ID=CAMNT_0000940681 /DNA_START=27 /DNA_END=914 /DNA_ORIENTATION=+ /assembly_acc=CAM_ASM_000762
MVSSHSEAFPEHGSICYGVDKSLSKTERRRLAKKAKKNRLHGEGLLGGKKRFTTKKGKKRGIPATGPEKVKPKMSKEERREKFTQQARERQKQKQLAGANAKVVCFGCRQKGHALAQCPLAQGTPPAAASASASASGHSAVQGGVGRCCYNCGSTEHTLRQCTAPKKGDGMSFAVCFLCKEKGHISAKCPQNEHGIYPKGGQCNVCGSKLHLASNCPQRKYPDQSRREEGEDGEEGHQASQGAGGDHSDLATRRGDILDDFKLPGDTNEAQDIENASKKKKTKVVEFLFGKKSRN